MKKIIFCLLIIFSLLEGCGMNPCFAQWNKIVYGYGVLSGSTITMVSTSFGSQLMNGQQISAHIYSPIATDSEEIALITYTTSGNYFTINSITINYHGTTASVSFPDTNVIVRYNYPLFWSDGGTGQITSNLGLNALLPSQTSNSGKFLTTNGTNTSWAATSGTVTSVAVSGANGIGVSGSPITSSGTIALSLGTITGATWHGNAIDLTAYATGQLPYANGGESGTAATLATSGSITVNMTTAIITITPAGGCQFNASGGLTGQIATFVITTSGSSSFTLQWNSNFKTTGNLATGTSSGKIFCVTFLCIDGTNWYEISRTIGM